MHVCTTSQRHRASSNSGWFTAKSLLAASTRNFCHKQLPEKLHPCSDFSALMKVAFGHEERPRPRPWPSSGLDGSDRISQIHGLLSSLQSQYQHARDIMNMSRDMLLDLCKIHKNPAGYIVRGRVVTAHFVASLHRLKPAFISPLHSQKPSYGFVIGAPRTEKLSLLMPDRQEYIAV